MGTETRSGFGFGMNLSEAKRFFVLELNRHYGEDEYSGGGNDIRDWLKVECLQMPVPASSATKTKSVKVAPKTNGKLVNGYRITTETPDLLRRQALSLPVPDIMDSFVLTRSNANKIAEELALKHKILVYVIPSRLWQDKLTSRLSIPSRITEVIPSGGVEAKIGKWQFEVEVRM